MLCCALRTHFYSRARPESVRRARVARARVPSGGGLPVCFYVAVACADAYVDARLWPRCVAPAAGGGAERYCTRLGCVGETSQPPGPSMTHEAMYAGRLYAGVGSVCSNREQ